MAWVTPVIAATKRKTKSLLPSSSRSVLPAIFLVVVTGFLLATMDGLAKYLSATYPVLFVLWGRYFFHTLLTFTALASKGSFSFLRARRPGLQLLRAGFLLCATGNMYVAVTKMPLADATAIMFLFPLLIVALSVPILKEKVGPRRWAAVGVGFIGILLIVQPGSETMNPYAVLPLFTAISVSLYLIMTRILKDLDDPDVTTFYATAVAATALTVILPFHFTSMTGPDWLLMIVMGGVGAMGHFLIVKAFHIAPASVLAPFTYTQLIGATLFGMIVFGDVPDLMAFCGAALVVGSGIFVWYRETFHTK